MSFRALSLLPLAGLLLSLNLSAADLPAVQLQLPEGISERFIVNRITMPIPQREGQEDICYASVKLPKFQYGEAEKPEGLRKLEKKWFRMGLRSVHNFLRDVEYNEKCVEDMFGAANSSDLSYTFVGQFGDFVSMALDEYGYSGGAHGYFGQRGMLLNLKTGIELKEGLGELLIPSSKDKIFELLETKMRAQDVPLDEYGGWELWKEDVEDISDIKNFLVSRRGVTVVFNPYEVGPYSGGMVDVDLSWKELEGLANNSELVKQIKNSLR